MEALLKKFAVFCAAACLAVLTGCGYTSKTLLPDTVKTVHVEQVRNAIDITGEVTNRQSFKVYRPGVEVDLRNALIDRFVFDGHLKIAAADKADSILRTELLSFRRDPLRYNTDDSIQEFRITVSASVQFVDTKTGKEIWQISGISGDSDYFLSGPQSKSEDEAVAAALEDLARHVVENVLEVW